MKSILGYLLLIGIFAILSIYAGELRVKSGVDIISHDIRMSMNDAENLMNVKVHLKIKKDDTVSAFNLAFITHGDLQSIKAKMGTIWIGVQYRLEGNGEVSLTLNPRLASYDTLTIEFNYTLRAGRLMTGYLVFERLQRWYPMQVDDIAPFKLDIELPKKYAVFSSGTLTTENLPGNKIRYLWESDMAILRIPLVMVQVDYFKSTVDDCGGNGIEMLLAKDDSTGAGGIADDACQMAQFYKSLLGPCPYNRLRLFEYPESRDVDVYSGLIISGTNNIEQFKDGYVDRLSSSIAQQWISCSVHGEILGPGFWLIILSLPHYLSLMELEHREGSDVFNERLQFGLDQYKTIIGTPNDVPIIDIEFIDTPEKARTVYGKGAYALEQVRKKIGDEGWRAFLKDLYGAYKGDILTYNSFRNFLMKFENGKEAASLLDRYVTEAGLPEID